MTPYELLNLHLQRYVYKRGANKGDAPLEKRSKSHVRIRRVDANTLAVRMYETDILTVRSDGTFTIALDSWETSTTIALAQHLKARGLQVGVVSRGHGRSGQDVRAVLPSDDAEQVGDEPLLMARATAVPVFVAPRRWDAASALLAAHPQTDIILCDDGLQHYALRRDLEVCVFDDRGLGNGWLLPSGPLREPWPRKPLARVGQTDERLLVLHTGATPAFDGFRAKRTLASHAIAAHLISEAVRAPFAISA